MAYEVADKHRLKTHFLQNPRHSKANKDDARKPRFI